MASDKPPGESDGSDGKWLANVSAVMDKQACGELFLLLNRQQTAALVNEAKAFTKRAWRSEAAAALLRQLNVTVDTVWAAACSCNLYYRVLVTVIQRLAADNDDTEETTAHVFMRDLDAQQALLNVAVELVLAICHAKPTFPAMTEMMGRTHLTLYQWDASLMWEFHLPSVSEALCVAGHQAVLQKISFMRLVIMESLAWQNGSCIFKLMELGETDRTSAGLVRAFILESGSMAEGMAGNTCSALAEDLTELQACPSFSQDCQDVVALVLTIHLDLLFGQHMASLVACAIYGVARTHSVPLAFKRICAVLVKHFGFLSHGIFQQVELCSGLDESDDPGDACSSEPSQAFFGELRIFYNTKFLPRMQAKLLDIAPKPPSTVKRKSTRLPLRSLSAQDVNIRQGSTR